MEFSIDLLLNREGCVRSTKCWLKMAAERCNFFMKTTHFQCDNRCKCCCTNNATTHRCKNWDYIFPQNNIVCETYRAGLENTTQAQSNQNFDQQQQRCERLLLWKATVREIKCQIKVLVGRATALLSVDHSCTLQHNCIREKPNTQPQCRRWCAWCVFRIKVIRNPTTTLLDWMTNLAQLQLLSWQIVRKLLHGFNPGITEWGVDELTKSGDIFFI